MILDLPPQLILPDHYENKRPAVIRPADDLRLPSVDDLLKSGHGQGEERATSIPVNIVKAKSGPTLTYVDAYISTSNAATYTSGSLAIGHPTKSSLVIIGVSSNGAANRGVSSGTIAGSAATVHVNPGGDWQPCAILSREVAAGTTGTVSVTFNSTVQDVMIAIWNLTDYVSATPFATAGQNGGGTETNPLTVSMNIPENGVAVYAYVKRNANAATWSSATSRYNDLIESIRHSAADKTSLVAITPHVESITQASGAGRGSAAACWR